MVTALRWSGFRSIIKLSASLVVPIILARLLSPNEFGLIAMGAVFTNISVLIADLGTGDALIQKQKADQILESSVFWLNIGIAGFLAGILVFFAPFIGKFYGETVVADVVLFLSLVLLIQSVNLVQVALLKKNRDFKPIAIAEVGSQVGGAILAIILAVLGFGVWSLIYYAIAKALFYSIVIWVFSRWRPNFYFDVDKIRTIFNFSLNLTTVKFLNYVERNSDKLIIGYWQGTSSLGVYTRAYESFHQIIKFVNGLYSPVFYSVVSNKQNDLDGLKKILLLSYQGYLYIFIPISAVLIMLSSKLVLLVFGDQWLEMAPILSVLGAICLVKPIHKLNVEIFKSVNKVDTLRRVWVFFTPIFVGGFFIGNHYFGSVGVATAYLVISCIITIVTTYLVASYLSITARNMKEAFLILIFRGVSMCFCMIAVLSPLISGWSNGNLLIELAMQLFSISIIYLGLQFVFPVKAQREIFKMLRSRS